MSAGGTLFADGPEACPFVALEIDRDQRSDQPDHRHRCYAEPTPAPRSIAHQEAYCLSPSFPACPIFQDWAARAAARPVPSGQPRPAAERPGPAAAVVPAALSPASPEPETVHPVEPTAEPVPAFVWQPEPDPDAEPALGTEPEAHADEQARDEEDQAEPEVAPEPASLAGVPPLPAFLAGRSQAPREAYIPPPSRPDAGAVLAAGSAAGSAVGADQVAQVSRTDLVPSWDIDDRYGAQTPASARQDTVNRIITAFAVLAILSVAIAIVLLVPSLLAGPGATPTPTATAPVAVASGTPSPTSAVLPTASAEPSATTPVPTPAATSTPSPQGSQQFYRIQPGDQLKRVARRFGVTVDEILAANPEIDDPNHIEVGQLIVIPPPSASQPTATP